MKRSEINQAYRQARDCFSRHCWALPPNARWDITDFGLGNFAQHGLTLVNLAEESEYCEKVMYALHGQKTPCHAHAKKKEDIICRSGILSIWLWPEKPLHESPCSGESKISINGVPCKVDSGEPLMLHAGWRVTLPSGVWHAFAPVSEECIIGEVSTANNDRYDNTFLDPKVGRFPGIEEDESAQVRLTSE